MTRAVWCIAEAAHRVPGISGRLMRKEMRQFCRMPLNPPTQLADRSYSAYKGPARTVRNPTNSRWWDPPTALVGLEGGIECYRLSVSGAN